MRALLNALAPLIGAETELSRAVASGWANDVPAEKISEWRKKGAELKDELERVAQETCSVEYGRLMHKVRLSLFFIAVCSWTLYASAWHSVVSKSLTSETLCGHFSI